ncbi:MAG: bifunctional enoyl-CoA hydratase/phosphate acetyltransferase [Alphaproteobacteria bacterium]
MSEIVPQNRTFDELRVGDTASLTRTIERNDLARFDVLSPSSDAADGAFATSSWLSGLVSIVLDTRLPGPGTTPLDQSFHFPKPVEFDDVVTATVRVAEKRPEGRRVLLEALCVNRAGEPVLTGTVSVTAPDRRIVGRPAQDRHSRYDAFVTAARTPPALRAGIVHPCSPEAISAAVEARDAGLLDPLLIGPEAKIRAAAEKAGVSLAGMTIEPTPHSHAAATRAVELAAAGKLSALVKGSLHTDELLSAVVAPGSALRTERRISHVYAMDIPAYPKPLIVTDAAINIQPTLEHKRDICQNAIDLCLTLGMHEPLVAVLAAVETVSPKMPATLDAAALTVMAMRGQIIGAKVDGPLAFDNAISPEAARTKEIRSPVAGHADILVVPDLESGNMLAKQLIYFAGATAAGLVLGAHVPIVLTSRADPLSARIASAALAKLVATIRPLKGPPK